MLEILGDGKPHHIKELAEKLAKHFNLTSEERGELLASGKQPKFLNRVIWARLELIISKLAESPQPGF